MDLIEQVSYRLSLALGLALRETLQTLAHIGEKIVALWPQVGHVHLSTLTMVSLGEAIVLRLWDFQFLEPNSTGQIYFASRQPVEEGHSLGQTSGRTRGRLQCQLKSNTGHLFGFIERHLHTAATWPFRQLDAHTHTPTGPSRLGF